MEKPIILCFGMLPPELRAVSELANRLGAEVKAVEGSELSLPIAAIAKGVRAPVLSGGGNIPERMMVFVSFPQAMLEVIIQVMREKKIGIGALKAVLTPTNASWTPMALYTELCAEREAFSSGSQQH